MDTSTQAKSFREVRRCTRKAYNLLDDAGENVEAPSSQCRQRMSLERYTTYMELMGECVVTKPSSF